MATVIEAIGENLQAIENAIVASQVFIDQCALEGLYPRDVVHWHALRVEDVEGDQFSLEDFRMPFVVLDVPAMSFELLGTSCYAPQITVRMLISDRSRAENHKESFIGFVNFYGALLADIWQGLNTTDERPVFRSYVQQMPPERTMRTRKSSTNDIWRQAGDFVIGADV